MNRSARRLLIIGSGAALIVAAAANASFASASASTSAAAPQASLPSVTMSVDAVRASFVSSGYQVDQPHVWSWMNPPFTSVEIHDPASQRVLMAMIYPDSAAAARARTLALAHDAAKAEPHLIEGYGPSVWSGNVAMVESTQSELDHIFQTRLDQTNGVEMDTNLAWEHSVSSDAVDVDFQEALVISTGAVNL